jgi:hypothetical protein
MTLNSYLTDILDQGGKIFWLRKNLQDLPDMLPEIASKKDYDNCIDFYNIAYFLKSTGNNPYLQEFIPINRKSIQKSNGK